MAAIFARKITGQAGVADEQVCDAPGDRPRADAAAKNLRGYPGGVQPHFEENHPACRSASAPAASGSVCPAARAQHASPAAGAFVALLDAVYWMFNAGALRQPIRASPFP